MSSKDAEKLRKQAKAQLIAKYGRLMALYLTGKNGNFAGIPKEAKDLADSILTANDERSLRTLYNVTKQLKTNSKKQMKDVPAMMGLPPPQGDDYTSVVQSIPSITLSHHVLSQHKVDLYRKKKDDQGVVSFKKISSKQEKDDDTLEITYGGTLGIGRITEQIEEKDIKSKISLKKVDVPTWTKYFEDNKARLLESEEKWLKQRKGTLTGEEKRKCEQKLKAIDEILKQLKKDELKRRIDESEKIRNELFQTAVQGKIRLGEGELYLDQKEQKLRDLPDQDAVKVAIIETIDARVLDESNPPFFINLDYSNLAQIKTQKDVQDLQDKSLDYMLKNVYVIESEWGSATAEFKIRYKKEIGRKNLQAVKEDAAKKKKEAEAKKSFEGKFLLKDRLFFYDGKTQKLKDLPFQAFLQTALKKTINDQIKRQNSFLGDGGFAWFFKTPVDRNSKISVLEPFTNETMVNNILESGVFYFLENTYVLAVKWGAESKKLQAYYQEEIDKAAEKKKKADAAAMGRLKVKTATETAAARAAAQETLDAIKAETDAAMKKRKELKNAEIKQRAARMTAFPRPVPKPSAPPSDQMKQETKDDEVVYDSGLSDPNSLYSRILRQKAEMPPGQGDVDDVPSDCFDMLPKGPYKMPLEYLELQTGILSSAASALFNTERNNIFKILFLYALKHKYMELYGVAVDLICYRDNKLYYQSSQTENKETEVKAEDLKEIMLYRNLFKEVSKNFLNRNKLPLFFGKRKSDFAAKTFPDKYRFVALAGSGISLTQLNKNFITLEDAEKDMKWLWNLAKERSRKLMIFVKDAEGWLGKQPIYRIQLLGLKEADDPKNITNESLVFQYTVKKDNKTIIQTLPYEDASPDLTQASSPMGPMLSTVYVPKSIAKPAKPETISTFARKKKTTKKKKQEVKVELSNESNIADVDFAAPPAPRFVMQYEEGVTPALYSARVPERHEL